MFWGLEGGTLPLRVINSTNSIERNKTGQKEKLNHSRKYIDIGAKNVDSQKHLIYFSHPPSNKISGYTPLQIVLHKRVYPRGWDGSAQCFCAIYVEFIIY